MKICPKSIKPPESKTRPKFCSGYVPDVYLQCNKDCSHIILCNVFLTDSRNVGVRDTTVFKRLGLPVTNMSLYLHWYALVRKLNVRE